jgi:small-conductance mechanosensitive channel
VKASFFVVALLACVVSASALAGDDDGTATSTGGVPSARADSFRPSAAVVVFNRRIVRFRAPVLGVPVDQRAQNASERIRALLRAPGEHKVTTERVTQGIIIKIDGHIALAITHDDAEQLGEVAEDTMAADAVRQLDRVIAEMKEVRDPRALLVAAGWTAGATAIWLAALWLLRRMMRVTARRLFRYAEAKSAQMRAAGTEIVQRERVLETIRVGLRAVFWALVLLFTYEWLGYVLGRFPYTRPWGESFATFLVDTFFDMLSAVADSVPGLLVAVAIFVIAQFANNMLRSFFDGVQAGRLRFTWIDADSVPPTRRLVTIAVWLFAVAMAYPYIPGAETDAFRGLSVLLGLMVSVGASGIVGQAASGLILMYTRTYRPGEYVRVGESEGTVVYLGMFTTRVRTGMGEELTLPNSMVLGTVTKNYSRAVHGAGFIVDATVTIGYDTPWRQVHAMLIEAAQRTPGVLADPAPRVFQLALSDFYVDYRLVCQAIPTEPRPRAVVVSALLANIQDVFNENGVQIMSPHYLGDPDAPKVVPKAHWYAPPAKPP